MLVFDDVYMNVVLLDLPWQSNLAVEGSNEYNKLVEEFKDQVGFIIFFRVHSLDFRQSRSQAFSFSSFVVGAVARHMSN